MKRINSKIYKMGIHRICKKQLFRFLRWIVEHFPNISEWEKTFKGYKTFDNYERKYKQT